MYADVRAVGPSERGHWMFPGPRPDGWEFLVRVAHYRLYDPVRLEAPPDASVSAPGLVVSSYLSLCRQLKTPEAPTMMAEVVGDDGWLRTRLLPGGIL